MNEVLQWGAIVMLVIVVATIMDHIDDKEEE